MNSCHLNGPFLQSARLIVATLVFFGAIEKTELKMGISAQATAQEAPSAKTHNTQFSFQDQGQEYRFRLESKINSFGQFQVNAYFLQSRGFYDTEKLVFYGRDLDGDLYPETWFIRQDIFIPQIIRHTQTRKDATLGQDAIEHIVKDITPLEKENFFKELFFQAGHIGTTTVSNMLEAKDEFVENEVELSSLQVQINRQKDMLFPGKILSRDWQTKQILVEQGYNQNLIQLDKALEGNYWRSALIETAIDVSMIKVGEFVSRGGVWLAKRMGSMSRAAVIAESFEAFSQRFKNRIGMGEKAEAVLSEGTQRGAYALSHRAVMSRVRLSLKELAAKNIMAEKVLGALVSAKQTYVRGALENFKYMAQTQTLQLLAEAFDKRHEIYDPNPIVMAKKFFSDKDFLQDFAFMTHETILQSGIAAGPGSLKRRVAVAGIISFVDSSVMNIAIKGVVDPKRIGMDTGWEVVIGNLQTQMDFAAIDYFRRYAIRQNNPKLKLVGFAIALVDQFSGYLAYAKVSKAIQPEVQLIPVLAEVN